jgi:hypothetical protein
LSRIFCEQDDVIILEGDQILPAETFAKGLVDKIQNLLAVFEKPFADPVLSADGHILSLYKSMHQKYLNLNILVQVNFQNQIKIAFNGAQYHLSNLVKAV